MTEKRSSKDRVKSVNAARPREEYLTYWVTRDNIGGVLCHYVDVWTVRPERTIDELTGDTRWRGLNADGTSAHFGQWRLHEAYKQIRAAIPDDDRQCVRNGPEPATPQVVGNRPAVSA